MRTSRSHLWFARGPKAYIPDYAKPPTIARSRPETGSCSLKRTTMALPTLRCPQDALHNDFRGRIQAYTCYDVALDPDWNDLGRANPIDLGDPSDPAADAVYCAICDAEVWSRPRAISFSPDEGTVLVCDFSDGFRPPEMTEKRPCVVISKRRTNRGLCVVVPISSTASTNPKAIVVAMPVLKYPFLRRDGWAKCHAPSTVSITRLSMMRDPATGRGLDTRNTVIDPADLAAVRQGVARFIGALVPGNLTPAAEPG
jgi:mRNA interferase MazF